MKTKANTMALALAIGACFAPGAAWAFNSGSTGADGAFSPTVNTTLPLPPGGIFNFTSVNIPAGVSVSFQKNTTNTPVVILASGDVTIAGVLWVGAAAAPGVGPAGDGATGDDGASGAGGPGGFDGGRGGIGGTAAGVNVLTNKAGSGLGPGGGANGVSVISCSNFGRTSVWGGTGGGFATAAAAGSRTSPLGCGASTVTPIPGGAGYGSSALLPLIGGSGGGGGGGGESAAGAGGGGGGGSVLIAASGTVSVTGSIFATGGAGGNTSLANATWGAAGGGGSGGAIRIVATTISGNGTINAAGGAAGVVIAGGNCCQDSAPSAGAAGRVRLEAETYTRTAASTPTHTFAAPGQVFVAGTPTLAISSVAGVNAPAAPTGNADITLAASTPNPVSVVFTTAGVPVGNTVQLTVTPAYGDRITAITPALTGSTASATASVNVNLPVGPSVLSAQTTYTVVAALGDLLRNYAGNERVEKVTLIASFGGPQKVKLTTVSGREYEAPAEALRIAALGG